jgi:hypothetical protein
VRENFNQREFFPLTVHRSGCEKSTGEAFGEAVPRARQKSSGDGKIPVLLKPIGDEPCGKSRCEERYCGKEEI